MIRLRSYEFRREREAGWRDLEALLARIDDGGLQSLAAADLSRLPQLYRSALSSLSVARAISLDRNVLDYLESLAARAHVAVTSARRPLRESMADFVGSRFPRAVRAIRWHVALAAAFLALGTICATAMVRDDLARYEALIEPALAQGRDTAATAEELRRKLYSDERGVGGALVAFASFLFTHNAKIGMLCFALGFLAGLPVFLLLFVNGVMLGAFTELHRARGLGVDVWGWLLPHGVTEMLAMVLCGAAGLVLADAVVFPGRHSRLHNLALRGREAGIVVLGAVGMFLVAGLIEGIFRQTVVDVRVRFAVAGATALFWAVYFGRRR